MHPIGKDLPLIEQTRFLALQQERYIDICHIEVVSGVDGICKLDGTVAEQFGGSCFPAPFGTDQKYRTEYLQILLDRFLYATSL